MIKRFCLADPTKDRPCKRCEKVKSTLEFYDDVYAFWSIDHGEDETLTLRVPPHRTVDNRLLTLGPEIARELAEEREKIKNSSAKFGPAWTFLESVKIGASERIFRKMLSGIEGKPRRATMCEMARWLNHHEEDMQNLLTNLAKLWEGWGSEGGNGNEP